MTLSMSFQFYDWHTMNMEEFLLGIRSVAFISFTPNITHRLNYPHLDYYTQVNRERCYYPRIEEKAMFRVPMPKLTPDSYRPELNNLEIQVHHIDSSPIKSSSAVPISHHALCRLYLRMASGLLIPFWPTLWRLTKEQDKNRPSHSPILTQYWL